MKTMKMVLCSFALAGVLFFSSPMAHSQASENMGVATEGMKKYLSSKNSTSNSETTRFERIVQSNGRDMATEVSKLLSQYGWEGWGHKKYDFGKWTEEQMKEKRRLFDDWAADKGFEWIDPVWSFSGSDLRVTEILSGCKELTHSVIAPNTKVESRPASLILPLDVGLGPIAVYKIDSEKISNDLMHKRYAVVIRFNDLPVQNMTNGSEIRTGVPFFYNSAYLIDLEACEYQRLLNLGGSYLGGYTSESIPRLTGVGYRNGRLALYDVHDISPVYRGGRQKELQAYLYFFDLSPQLRSDPALELFFRPTSTP